MSTERCNPHPIESDGTSWRQRAVEALDPAVNPVDGRELGDLIGYAERYARMLQFWDVAKDANNEDALVRDSDWQDFVRKDVSALIARISREDIPGLRDEFKAGRTAVEAASGAALPAAFSHLYAQFADIAGRLDAWFRASPAELSLSARLEGWIASSLGSAMRTVIAQARRAAEIDVRVVVPDVSTLHRLWQLEDVLPDASVFAKRRLNDSDDQVSALEQLAQAHGQFLLVLQQLLDDSAVLLQETLDAYPQHQPHMALLLAFLQLFGRAQEHLNRLTAEHLKFYYREVLGIKPTEPVPDKVHLVLEPAKNLAGDPKIAVDTAFKAGKDGSGVEQVYASDEELVINQAQVDEEQGLKSLFIDMQNGRVANIHAAVDADSADGLGADLSSEDGSWQTFGGTDMPYADVGFAVASPMLLLNEGERTIVVRFALSEPFAIPEDMTALDVARELCHNIQVQGSGEKGWIDLDIHEVTFSDDDGDCLKFRLHLDATAPAMVAYDGDTLDGGFATGQPLLHFILDNEGLPADEVGDVIVPEAPEEACEAHTVGKGIAVAGGRKPGRKIKPRSLKQKAINYEDGMSYFAPDMLVRYGGKLYRPIKVIDQAGFRPENFPETWASQEISYPYRYLQGLQIRGLRIEVRVRGMRNLLLENDQGILDPAKPFNPFGPVPRRGSAFLVGSPEVFGKSLDEVRLELAWADLPTVNFEDYYDGYTSTSPSTNQYFTAAAALLQDGDWIPVGDPVALFDDAGGAVNPPAVTRCLKFEGDAGEALLTRSTDLGSFKQYRAGMRQGFMRLQLDNHGFGHDEYPRLLASEAAKGAAADIPNAPHVPLISGLTLSYKASEEINFEGVGLDGFDQRVEQLFQVWPFGRREIWPIGDVDDPGEVPVERRLLPHFEATSESGTATNAEGTLYVGLKGLDLSAGSKNLSLLVQVAEGSADPDLPVQDVVWSYLVNDVWVDFTTSEILADDSNGLLRSGIVRFALPKVMNDDNHILPAGCHWLKASASRNTAAVCKVIALHTQALTASFRDQGNDPSHLQTPLKSGTISKLQLRNAAIKKVAQPYASFGGEMAEADDAFYVRVSERLRHKGRAISMFDYERLVLQAFPQVYKIKCINHAERHLEHAPGSVLVIVVPDLRNRNAVDPLRPKASLDTLDRIRDYLAQRCSDFVNLDVTNPDYEAIRVKCEVRFHTGYDQGYYLGQIVTDIQNFLSPWLHDEGADISFGGRIHRSRVLEFVESLAYVDFVTDFRIDHQVGDDWRKDVEQAEASHAAAVLVSAEAEQYEIGVNISSCLDEPRDAAPEQDEEEAHWAGPRFLGNTLSRELHDLNGLTPLCHIDRIAEDRQRRFYSIADAREAGYDLCAHCFGRDRSRR